MILGRTPYNNMTEESIESAVFYPQHGYVFVAQDVRGKNDSEGDFYAFANEFEDGHDTVEWIGAQPWCDGNVGMVGASYVGNVQWQAAVMGSKYLKTIVPRVIGHNMHEANRYVGGALHLSIAAMWAMRHDGRTRQDIMVYNWEQLFSTLPVNDLDRRAGKRVDFYQDWVKHADYDDYWKSMAIEERYEDVRIPVLQIGGWYDICAAGTFHNFIGMRERGGTETARANQRAVVGPWIHSASSLTHAGEVDFGKESMLDLQEVELRWFDHWLKGIDNGAADDPPLRIFVMGANEWRDEREWPLARTEFTPTTSTAGARRTRCSGTGSCRPRRRRRRRPTTTSTTRPSPCRPAAATPAAPPSSSPGGLTTSAPSSPGPTCSSTPPRRWRRMWR